MCTYLQSLTLVAGLAIATASAAEPTPKWTITLNYGGGAPHDAGPLGHCTATISSAGTIHVESKNRQKGASPEKLVVLDHKALSPEKLADFHRAANEATAEKPYHRRGSNEDGNFLILKLDGEKQATVAHRELNNFSDAPAGILKLVKLLNEQLPEEERIPLEKSRAAAKVVP